MITHPASIVVSAWRESLSHVHGIYAVSPSEPAHLLLMGLGLLLAGRALRRVPRASGRTSSTWGLWSPASPMMKVVSSACLILLASVLATSCAKNHEVAKRKYLQSGDSYFADSKYKEAIVQYRNAVQQDARFGEARYKLAETYVRVNEPAAAYREYIRAADLMPDHLDAQLKAGQMLLLARQFEDAKTRADRILAKDPQHVPAQILRGNALAGLKDLDGAIAQIEEAITIDPDRGSTYGSLGAVQLAKGDQHAAEEAFTQAVKIDGTSVRARLALALFYLSARRVADAEAALKETLAIDGSNTEANQMLALICLGSNRAAEAEPYLKTFAEVSKTVAAQLALADYYMRMNRTSEAIQLLTTIGASDPPAFAAAQTRLAAIEYARGQKIDAHQRVDKVLGRQPKHVAALVLKARFLQAEHKLDEALARAKMATDAEQKSLDAWFSLGRLYAATGQLDEAAKAFNTILAINPRVSAAQIERSRVQLAGGNVEASLQSVREALKNQPDDPDARLLLARGLIAHRELAEAEHEMRALLAQRPNAAPVHSQMGLLYLAKGDPIPAKQSFERAIALDGHSLEALSGLVSLDLIAKTPQKAQARVEARLAETPDDTRLLRLAAVTYATTANPARAEDALRRAIRIDPANLETHEMLGRVFLSAQKLEQAKSEFGAVATGRPNSNDGIDAQTMVALILEAQNRPVDAQKQFEQILAASPRAVVPANNLAWLYAERGGNLDVALGLAQTAVQEAPDQPAVNDTLGWIYYKKGMLARAIDAFHVSVEKDSTNPVYHYHLGLAYSKNGDRVRAKQSLEKALTLSPDFNGSSDARKALASVKS